MVADRNALGVAYPPALQDAAVQSVLQQVEALQRNGRRDPVSTFIRYIGIDYSDARTPKPQSWGRDPCGNRLQLQRNRTDDYEAHCFVKHTLTTSGLTREIGQCAF
jgi:hypothetical protein